MIKICCPNNWSHLTLLVEQMWQDHYLLWTHKGRSTKQTSHKGMVPFMQGWKQNRRYPASQCRSLSLFLLLCFSLPLFIYMCSCVSEQERKREREGGDTVYTKTECVIVAMVESTACVYLCVCVCVILWQESHRLLHMKCYSYKAALAWLSPCHSTTAYWRNTTEQISVKIAVCRSHKEDSFSPLFISDFTSPPREAHAVGGNGSVFLINRNVLCVWVWGWVQWVHESVVLL